MTIYGVAFLTMFAIACSFLALVLLWWIDEE